MSKYTLELRYLASDKNNPVFNFDYEFYDNDLKSNFEKKFIDHFFEYEINGETPDMFRHRLRSRLNDIAPYYKQLYKSELEAKNVNFLLNKDLKETFIRELDNKSKSTSSGTSETNDNIKSDSTSIFSDTPQTSISDIDRYMTTANKDNSGTESTGNSLSNSSNENEETGREETTLISQGNIGVTSGGELLTAWRESMINIDMLIFKECEDLFLMVY